MKILIAGGAGEVGKHLVQYLTDQGHAVRVLDRAEKTKGLRDALGGDLSDSALVGAAVEGVDAIINLAWSFADDPQVIFCEDIRGHVNLLEAACTHKVSRFIYTSTATVYGKAVNHPVTEAHPCLIADARKPLYALGKYTAEVLCQYYFKTRGLPATVFRFWWAFGATIGGSNLRDLVRKSTKHLPLEMVPGAGGAFLTMADLGRAIQLSISKPAAAGQVYNLGSLFMSWEEIGEMIIGLTDSRSLVQQVSSEKWLGAAFLNEVWDLDWGKAKQEIGYEPINSVETMKASFIEALKSCVAQVRSEDKVQ